ncbi:hypothetical protein [Dyella sp. A6]|nr:hypothetical protein [Dyella sp. A6]
MRDTVRIVGVSGIGDGKTSSHRRDDAATRVKKAPPRALSLIK